MSWNLDESDLPDTPFERAELLQNMLIGLSQNGGLDEAVYRELRRDFMASDLKPLLPSFVRTCRDGGQLWGHLSSVASGPGSWGIRREHIYGEFRPMLDHLESRTGSPAEPSISETLTSFDESAVHGVWEKALQRKREDPEGAITSARTLLETVCKRILDEEGIDYTNDDLPKLYKKTAEALNLAPSQHTEDAFKAILGGCQTIVQNLGTLRNKVGDAHGQGRNPIKPAERHAALAVNLAGSMATFLVETWQVRQNK